MKLILAIIVAFVAIFVIEFLVHGLWLGSAYKATAHLWRPEAEMPGKMPWMLMGQLIVAAGIATIYMKAMADRATIMCAAGFGLCIGLISAGGQLIMYAVAPYPGSLVAKWCLAGLLEGLILGLTLFFVFKPRPRK